MGVQRRKQQFTSRRRILTPVCRPEPSTFMDPQHTTTFYCKQWAPTAIPNTCYLDETQMIWKVAKICHLIVKHASKISLPFAAENSSKFLGLVLAILLNLDNLMLPHLTGIQPLQLFKSAISLSFAFVAQLVTHSMSNSTVNLPLFPGIVYEILQKSFLVKES